MAAAAVYAARKMKSVDPDRNPGQSFYGSASLFLKAVSNMKHSYTIPAKEGESNGDKEFSI